MSSSETWTWGCPSARKWPLMSRWWVPSSVTAAPTPALTPSLAWPSPGWGAQTPHVPGVRAAGTLPAGCPRSRGRGSLEHGNPKIPRWFGTWESASLALPIALHWPPPCSAVGARCWPLQPTLPLAAPSSSCWPRQPPAPGAHAAAGRDRGRCPLELVSPLLPVRFTPLEAAVKKVRKKN